MLGSNRLILLIGVFLAALAFVFVVVVVGGYEKNRPRIESFDVGNDTCYIDRYTDSMDCVKGDR